MNHTTRADITLSTGSVIIHSLMPNGATRAQRVDGSAMTDEEWKEYVQILRYPVHAFVAYVAHLKTDEDLDGDMSGDDACSILSDVVEQARELIRDPRAARARGIPVIIRTADAYPEVLTALVVVRSFLQALVDTADDSAAIDLLTNHLDDVELTVNKALKKAGIS